MVGATENERIINLAQTVYSQTRYYFLVLIWNSLTVRRHDIMDLKNIPVSHTSIYDAISKRDTETAVRLLREHINEGMKRYWQMANMLKYVDIQ
jgi:DNA-binding GntR family transcriptional regulator